MTEITKRILTSFILLIFLLVSFYNIPFLAFTLIFCFYQIFYEFYIILKKIFFKKKIRIYLFCLFIILFLLYVTLSLWLILSSNNFDEKVFLLFVIFISICSDIGGFSFGKIFKGKKLTKISPNKTYSGMCGSFILSILLAFLVFNEYYSLNFIFIFSLLISSVTQLGDLFVSFLKRRVNMKDTGSILPGHGGLLDRFDGIIFAIPFGLLLKLFL